MIGADHTTAARASRDLAEAVARAVPRLRIPGRNRTKADLLVYDLPGRTVAVKDYGARPIWFRQTAGRLLVRRECAAYRAAGGAPGLVPFLGRLGPFAMATEWVDARPLRESANGTIGAAVFDALGRIVEELHRRGVALGDLHHRDVLVAESGAVFVVDLATAWVLGTRPGPMRRRVFVRLQESDRVNLARMRARFEHGREADLDREVGPAAARRYRRSREWKSLWDRLRGRRRARP